MSKQYYNVPQKLNEEQIFQASCFLWYHNSYIGRANRKRLFMINNNAANRVDGNKYKSMGVVRGVADMGFVSPKGGVVFIEMKTPRGDLGSEQLVFMEMCDDSGQAYIVIRTKELFKKFIYGHLGEPDVDLPI